MAPARFRCLVAFPSVLVRPQYWSRHDEDAALLGNERSFDHDVIIAGREGRIRCVCVCVWLCLTGAGDWWQAVRDGRRRRDAATPSRTCDEHQSRSTRRRWSPTLSCPSSSIRCAPPSSASSGFVLSTDRKLQTVDQRQLDRYVMLLDCVPARLFWD